LADSAEKKWEYTATAYHVLTEFREEYGLIRDVLY
jgi:hypothetical protein